MVVPLGEENQRNRKTIVPAPLGIEPDTLKYGTPTNVKQPPLELDFEFCTGVVKIPLASQPEVTRRYCCHRGYAGARLATCQAGARCRAAAGVQERARAVTNLVQPSSLGTRLRSKDLQRKSTSMFFRLLWHQG